jgi:hypothetical protein
LVLMEDDQVIFHYLVFFTSLQFFSFFLLLLTHISSLNPPFIFPGRAQGSATHSLPVRRPSSPNAPTRVHFEPDADPTIKTQPGFCVPKWSSLPRPPRICPRDSPRLLSTHEAHG